MMSLVIVVLIEEKRYVTVLKLGSNINHNKSQSSFKCWGAHDTH